MILILLGRSGCGKSTIAAKLKEKYGYIDVRTCTTRRRRDDEPEDAYHFMSREQFTNYVRMGDFVEFDIYGGNMYGTLKSSLMTHEKLICVITPEGAKAIKEEFPNAFIVNIEADMKTSVIRAIAREKELDPDKMNQINKRACDDYYLYENPLSDVTIENPEGASIEDVAKRIAEAHMEYVNAR